MTDNNRPGESGWWRPDEPTQPLPPTEQIPPNWPQQQPPPYPPQHPPHYPQQYLPGYGGPPAGYGGPGDPKPPGKPRKSWVYGGIAAGLVALVGGGAVLVTTVEDTDKEAGDTVATTSTSSGTESSSEPLPTTTDTFTDGLTTGSPTPTATERKRTLRDIDQGLAIFDDVYIKPAKGWRTHKKNKHAISLVYPGRGAVIVVVDPVGYPAVAAARSAVQNMIDAENLTGVKRGTVRKVSAANSNIAQQAQGTFGGRAHAGDVSVTLTGKCTTMTGVESIHNVTVSVCVEAPKADSAAGFRDAAKMLSSVARSI